MADEEKAGGSPLEEPGEGVPDAGGAPASRAEVLSVEEILAEKDAQLGQLRAELLYQRAELENFKRRTEKRYGEALAYASEGLLKDLLPVLDNLERALSHAREGGSEGIDSLIEGLDHVLQQFLDALGRHDVAPVPSDGARFDPAVHDALAQVPGAEDGWVGDTYEKGYTWKGRLLRPAKVTVTKVAAPSGDG
ncbi:MAG: nucleotide exchange factor GrpE [Deferrisomatales bacterium]|nr:nucleotide exchange factor GrpE [Deferrisomatales bacterium]